MFCVLYHYSSDYGNLSLGAETIYLGSVKLLRKKIVIPLLAAVSIISMSIGAVAASNLEEITVYLNKGVSIKLDGEKWTPKDEAGNTLYPITYNGSTYLPVRAVGEASGLKVGWNEEKQKVLLGKPNLNPPPLPSPSPKAEVKSPKGVTEEFGKVVFYAYDKNGKFLGVMKDDVNWAGYGELVGLTPPPTIAEGWLDSNHLRDAYGSVNKEENALILTNSAFSTQVFYRFNIPEGFYKQINGDFEVDGVRIRRWDGHEFFNIEDLQKVGIFQ